MNDTHKPVLSHKDPSWKSYVNFGTKPLNIFKQITLLGNISILGEISTGFVIKLISLAYHFINYM